MPRTVIIKFESGEPIDYAFRKVPDNVSVDDVKKKAAIQFPGRKIIGYDTTDYTPGPTNTPKPGEKPSVDIEKSSEKPAGKTPTVDASSDESKKDYRADFPTLYTPPGFIRNKRGDLIYY
jgi:hypothetical protein